MKRCSCLFLSVAFIFLIGSCSYSSLEFPVPREEETNAGPSTPTETVLLSSGADIVNGAYFTFEDVDFYYDGEFFLVTNNRHDEVIVTVNVLGKQADGTYKFLGCPAFGGVNQEKYSSDMEKNGWAWEELTNRIQPGGTLQASMSLFSDGMDVDNDGYYDVQFQIHPQNDSTSIHSSPDDPVSNIYRITAGA